MFRSVALVAGLLFSSGAIGADQFDLICTGQVESQGSRPEPISRRYHVDLATNQWCYNECTIRQLAEVNSSQIVFEETKSAFRGDPEARLDYVDRTTGRWAFFTSFWQGEGACSRAPFTGFPTGPTKF